MSGTIRGKTDCFSNPTATYRQSNEYWKNLYDFLMAHPNAALIARNSGNGVTAGNTGFWDEANKVGGNAWATFRMNPTSVRPFPWYINFIYGAAGGGSSETNGNVGSGVGAGSLICGSNISGNSAPVGGLQFAIGEGGDENPWNGTASGGAAGVNDTKTAPWWKVPTSGSRVHVWPRTNNTGSADATNKNNYSHWYTATSSPVRVHFIADDDSLIILASAADDNNYSVMYFGLYEARTGATPTYPMIMIGSAQNLPLSITTQYGNPVNAGLGQLEGGVIPGATTNGVRNVWVDRYQNILSSAQQPNQQLSTPEYEQFPIPIYSNEATGLITIGHLGQITFMKESANLTTHDTNADLTRAAFGTTSLTGVKLMVPWGGGSPPRTTSTRGGTDWTRARVASDD